MYVGFAGVGGSGKSTTARAVKDRLEEQGYTVAYYSPFFEPGRSVGYKLFWAVYLWRWFDFELLRFFVVTTSAKFRMTRWTWWRIYMSLIFSYYLNQIAQDKIDVLIYDEDMSKWQALPVQNGDVSLDETLRMYNEHILAAADAGLVVFVETDAATAHERYVDRDDEAYAKDEYAERLRSWESYQIACSELVAKIETETLMDTLMLDGRATVSENAQIVTDQVINQMTS